MTEDEAKNKWCPFVRVSIGLDPAFTVHNRVADATTGDDSRDSDHNVNHPAAYNCIGSDCMAFRWNLLPNESHPMQMIPTPDKYSETDGYCGLAR